jgi:hypothetical protein
LLVDAVQRTWPCCDHQHPRRRPRADVRAARHRPALWRR